MFRVWPLCVSLIVLSLSDSISGQHIGQPVDVPVAHLVLSGSLDPDNIREGSYVFMECRVSVEHSTRRLVWFHEGKELKEGVGVLFTNRTLVLQGVGKLQSGAYHCLSYHDKGSYLSNAINLTVQYSPTVRMALGTSLDPENIKEGSDIYFECNFENIPLVYGISWFQNGNELEYNAFAGVILSNQTLVLQRLRRWHSGLYTCRVNSSSGSIQSNAVNITVQYAPKCASNQTITYAAHLHEGVQIKCQLEALPPVPVEKFTWTFNNSADDRVIYNHDLRYVSGESFSLLNYTPTTEQDYGTFRCWGRNQVGVQSEPCIFEIVSRNTNKGIPETPTSCSVDQDLHSMRVYCLPGRNGGLPQTFVAEVYGEEHNIPFLKITDSRNPYFSMLKGGMEEYAFVTAHVYAFNTMGASEKNFVELT